MREIKFGFFMPTGDFTKAKAAALWADTHGFYSATTCKRRSATLI
jgi:hypothetical protein